MHYNGRIGSFAECSLHHHRPIIWSKSRVGPQWQEASRAGSRSRMPRFQSAGQVVQIYYSRLALLCILVEILDQFGCKSKHIKSSTKYLSPQGRISFGRIMRGTNQSRPIAFAEPMQSLVGCVLALLAA